MQCIIIMVLAGVLDSTVLAVVYSALGFIYYVQDQCHIDKTLARMQDILNTFQMNKDGPWYS